MMFQVSSRFLNVLFFSCLFGVFFVKSRITARKGAVLFISCFGLLIGFSRFVAISGVALALEFPLKACLLTFRAQAQGHCLKHADACAPSLMSLQRFGPRGKSSVKVVLICRNLAKVFPFRLKHPMPAGPHICLGDDAINRPAALLAVQPSLAPSGGLHQYELAALVRFSTYASWCNQPFGAAWASAVAEYTRPHVGKRKEMVYNCNLLQPVCRYGAEFTQAKFFSM